MGRVRAAKGGERWTIDMPGILVEILKYVSWPNGELLVDMDSLYQQREKIMELEVTDQTVAANGSYMVTVQESWWEWPPKGGPDCPLWWNSPTKTVVSMIAYLHGTDVNTHHGLQPRPASLFTLEAMQASALTSSMGALAAQWANDMEDQMTSTM